MANQSVIIGGKAIPLVAPKADLNIPSRLPGGKYHVQATGLQLLAGTLAHGWYGEIAQEDLISYPDLVTAIGLSAGAAINQSTPWLGFSLDGVQLFVSKMPVRMAVSWNQINAIGCIYGTKTIQIAGKTYKVRVLKGSNTDPASSQAGANASSTHGSEWNRLLYHVSDGQGGTVLSSEGISVGDWAQYSNAALGCAGGNATVNICQNTVSGSSGNFMSRGVSYLSYTRADSKSSTSTVLGWRPVLELVG